MVTWNLQAARGLKPHDPRIDELAALANNRDVVVALQEVGPDSFETLAKSGVFAALVTSLSHRPPSPLERRARSLGVVLGVAGAVAVEHSDLLWRAPYPDRALVASLRWCEQRFDAWSVHSVTGVGYRNAKVDGFLVLAERLRNRSRPTLVGIDANCPNVDAPQLEDCVWWWDRGEPECFGHQAVHDVEDTFRRWLRQQPEVVALPQRSPLAITHARGPGTKRTPCRYDRVHASPEWRVQRVEHRFAMDGADGPGWRGSDHGPVIVDLSLDGLGG
jgi:hypothetical protein